MDAVLCLREATHFQSMELERPEAICGLESGTRSRLWSTRRDCVCRQEVAFIGLRLPGRKAWIGGASRGPVSVERTLLSAAFDSSRLPHPRVARVGTTNLSPMGFLECGCCLSSNSRWNSFDHALRRQGRNDPCELVACGVEQAAEFRFGSFSPSGHH